MNDDVMTEFTEKIAGRIFDGMFPLNVSPELLAVCVLECLPPFRDASEEVQDYFIDRFAPMIWVHQRMQVEAGRALRGSEWRS